MFAHLIRTITQKPCPICLYNTGRLIKGKQDCKLLSMGVYIIGLNLDHLKKLNRWQLLQQFDVMSAMSMTSVLLMTGHMFHQDKQKA